MKEKPNLLCVVSTKKQLTILEKMTNAFNTLKEMVMMDFDNVVSRAIKNHKPDKDGCIRINLTLVIREDDKEIIKYFTKEN